MNKVQAGDLTTGHSALASHVQLPLWQLSEAAGNQDEGAGEMAQLWKCLPHKREDLNPVPGTLTKKQCVTNLTTGEAETGRPVGLTGLNQ